MTATPAKRWPLLRVLLTEHLPFVAVLWVLFTVVALVVAGIIAVASPGVTTSVLHHMTTQAPRWLMFGLGIDAVSSYLRMQLAHGRTRREYLGQALLYAVVLSGFTAVLITIGYLLERGYYAVFGWSQRLSREAAFTAADQYPAILGTFWLSFLMWTIAGIVIGLGFFRGREIGFLTILAGIAIVLPSVALFRDGGLPILGAVIVDYRITVGVLIAACAAMFVVAVGMAWAIVRDVPMKAEVA
jgi:hypothetical protein